jgi:hypothetical protein
MAKRRRWIHLKSAADQLGISYTTILRRFRRGSKLEARVGNDRVCFGHKGVGRTHRGTWRVDVEALKKVKELLEILS